MEKPTRAYVDHRVNTKQEWYQNFFDGSETKIVSRSEEDTRSNYEQIPYVFAEDLVEKGKDEHWWTIPRDVNMGHASYILDIASFGKNSNLVLESSVPCWILFNLDQKTREQAMKNGRHETYHCKLILPKGYSLYQSGRGEYFIADEKKAEKFAKDWLGKDSQKPAKADGTTIFSDYSEKSGFMLDLGVSGLVYNPKSGYIEEGSILDEFGE